MIPRVRLHTAAIRARSAGRQAFLHQAQSGTLISAFRQATVTATTWDPPPFLTAQPDPQRRRGPRPLSATPADLPASHASLPASKAGRPHLGDRTVTATVPTTPNAEIQSLLSFLDAQRRQVALDVSHTKVLDRYRTEADLADTAVAGAAPGHPSVPVAPPPLRRTAPAHRSGRPVARHHRDRMPRRTSRRRTRTHRRQTVDGADLKPTADSRRRRAICGTALSQAPRTAEPRRFRPVAAGLLDLGRLGVAPFPHRPTTLFGHVQLGGRGRSRWFGRRCLPRWAWALISGQGAPQEPVTRSGSGARCR